MFDIGFSEIVVIGVVALVVIGPERLPKTARTLGHLFGRLQRYVNDVKADINREMELEELRKLQRAGQERGHATSQQTVSSAAQRRAGGRAQRRAAAATTRAATTRRRAARRAAAAPPRSARHAARRSASR